MKVWRPTRYKIESLSIYHTINCKFGDLLSVKQTSSGPIIYNLES